MAARVLHRLHQLGHDMRGRGGVRIAHAEIDNILSRGPCLGLGVIHLGKDVRGQATDTMKLFRGHFTTRTQVTDDGLNIPIARSRQNPRRMR